MNKKKFKKKIYFYRFYGEIGNSGFTSYIFESKVKKTK